MQWNDFVVIIFLGLVVVVAQGSSWPITVAQAGSNKTMFFIALVVGIIFFLAYACILCLILDNSTHVDVGVS